LIFFIEQENKNNRGLNPYKKRAINPLFLGGGQDLRLHSTALGHEKMSKLFAGVETSCRIMAFFRARGYSIKRLAYHVFQSIF
jgi:hypothetical protein